MLKWKTIYKIRIWKKVKPETKYAQKLELHFHWSHLIYSLRMFTKYTKRS